MGDRINSISKGNRSRIKSSKASSIEQASLGKLSFKQRLESYYSIVQPDLLSCPIEWGQRFDQIWDKFGGTVEGEQLLAAKLVKKYGHTTILFRTVTSSTNTTKSESQRRSTLTMKPHVAQHRNEWYELNEKEMNSGCIDFLLDGFDPIATLRQDANVVEKLNPFIKSLPMLERVDRFRSYLPICDPLYHPKSNNSKNTNTANKKTALLETNSHSTTSNTATTNALFRQVPICFVDTIKWHETGPYSLLYDALIHRQRIRVLVRYVNSIRGTLCGYVVAFDQHMNLLLRDVDEQYSPRRTNKEDDLEINLSSKVEFISNGEAEVQRRMDCVSQMSRCQTSNLPPNTKEKKWTVRQRHMSQIMVRGDVVVLIYKASEERSAWSSATNMKSTDDVITTSFQPPNDDRRGSQAPPTNTRFGTPGSFVIPERQRYNRKYDWNRTNRNIMGDKFDYKSTL